MTNTWFAYYGQPIPSWYSPGYVKDKEGNIKFFYRNGRKIPKRHFITSPGVIKNEPQRTS